MPSATDTFTYRTEGQQPETTQVQSLLGGGQIFGKVDQLLKQAKRSVFLDLYSLQSPELYPERSSLPGTPGAAQQAGLVQKLIDLKKQGVDVKVILDNHWDNQLKEGSNNRTIAELRKNNIDVVTYPNFSTLSHVKVMIVDNQFAMLGGMNWGNHSPTNHDAAVFLAGPDVRNIYNEVFKPDWVSSFRHEDELPKVAAFPEGRVEIYQTTAAKSSQGAKDEIFQEVLSQIRNAKSSIYAELFVLTQGEVIDSLIDAHKRLTKKGKEGVKILVDPGLFFVFPNCRAGVQKLARAGVPVRFLKTNRDAEEKLHAKWAVFDEKNLLIGSANWSNPGLLCNRAKEDATASPSALDREDGAESAEPPENSKSLPPENGYPSRLSKSNHEVALLLKSQKLSKTFSRQFRHDWRNTFPILMKSEEEGRWKVIAPNNNIRFLPSRQLPDTGTNPAVHL